MLEQTNEVMDVLGRPYGVPEDVDEDDLEAGEPVCLCILLCFHSSRHDDNLLSFPPLSLSLPLQSLRP